ncbi:hypothetical protein ACTA71_002671 [Dictyostelium dimigraforme]
MKLDRDIPIYKLLIIKNENDNLKEELEYSFSDNYKCQICEGFLITSLIPNRMKALQCINGHCFCLNCWESLLEIKSECPTCRVNILSINTLSNNLFIIKSISESIKIHCPNYLNYDNSNNFNGCKEIITIDDIDRHEGQCEFRFMKCSINDQCNEIFRFNQRYQHEIQCDFIIQECNHCNESVQKKQMQGHILFECLKVLITCQHCNLQFTRLKLQNHIENDCKEIKIECPFKSLKIIYNNNNNYYNNNNNNNNNLESNSSQSIIPLSPCNEPMKRCDITKHFIRNNQYHNELVSIILKKQDKKIKELETIIQQNNVNQNFEISIIKHSNSLTRDSFYKENKKNNKLIQDLMKRVLILEHQQQQNEIQNEIQKLSNISIFTTTIDKTNNNINNNNNNNSINDNEGNLKSLREMFNTISNFKEDDNEQPPEQHQQLPPFTSFGPLSLQQNIPLLKQSNQQSSTQSLFGEWSPNTNQNPSSNPFSIFSDSSL